jgi:predicted amidohydrolase
MNALELEEVPNVDYWASRMREPSSVRLACLPYDMRRVASRADFEDQVRSLVAQAADEGADLAVLPELMTCQLLSATPGLSGAESLDALHAMTESLVSFYGDLAVKHQLTLVAGSHLCRRGGQQKNMCPVCLPDGRVIRQSKVHVTPNERRAWGVVGGGRPHAIDTPKARIGVLICYDVEFPEAVRALEDEGIDVLVVPYCTDSREGHLRVRYCAQARAVESQVYVALAGAVGTLEGAHNMDEHVGQGAILTPSDIGFPEDGVAAESTMNLESCVVADADLSRLAACRESGSVTPRQDRRPDLYG